MWFIFRQNKLFLFFFIGASPDRLMTCDCCIDACVEIKYPLSINFQKPNEKNLDYLYKSDSEIKLKTNHSYFTHCILQTAVTNIKLCYVVVWTPHGKVLMTSCGRILKRN